MPWYLVTFGVEAENVEEFVANLDEDKIVQALPGSKACLVSFEVAPRLRDSIWKLLGRPPLGNA